MKTKTGKSQNGKPNVIVTNSMSIEQAAEVPVEERKARAFAHRVSLNQAKNAAVYELELRAEDRAAFLLGWAACAAAAKEPS